LDDLFDRVIPYIRFFWSFPFLIFSCLIMAFSSAMILYHIDEVAAGIFALYSFQSGGLMNFVVLWVVIIGIITIHELGHGLTCKYYGGEVLEMGILLLFFQPCFYCNVTDAWTFPTRGSRLWVTMAEGYIEYFIGSLAGLCWLITQETFFLHNLSFQVMLVCSLSTHGS